MDELKEEVDKLRGELQEANERNLVLEEVEAAYDSDTKAQHSTVETLNSQIKQLTSMKETTESAKKDLDTLQKGKCEDYNNLSVQRGQLETEVHALKEVISKIKLDSTSITDASGHIRTQLDITEKNQLYQKNTNTNLREQQEACQAENERLTIEKNSCQVQNVRLQSEQETLLAEKTTTHNTNAHLKATVSSLQNESDTLRTLLESMSRNVTASDAGHKSLTEQMDAHTSTIARIQKEHALLSKDFEEKLEEIKGLRAQKTALEKKAEEFRLSADEKTKLEVILGEKRQNEKEMAEEIVVIKSLNKKQETMLQESKDHLATLQSQLATTKNDKEKLMSEYKNFKTSLDQIQSNVEMAERKEKEMQKVFEENAVLKEKERGLLIEVEKSKGQSVQYYDECERMRRELDIERVKKEELKRELESVTVRVNENNDRYFKENSEVIKLKESLSQTEARNMTLSSDLAHIHANRVSLNEEISTLKSEVQFARRDLGDRDEQIVQLKSLVEAINKTRQDLLNRIQENSTTEKSTSDEKLVLVSENDAIRRELMASNERVSQLHTALTNLDREKDSVQEKLDRKIELVKEVETQLSRCKSEYSDAMCKMNDSMVSNESMHKKLAEKEQEIRELRSTLTSLNREMGNARNLLEAKARECKEKDEDLNLVTRENTSTRDEYMRSMQHQQQSEQELKQHKLKEGDYQQQIRALELEKADLLTMQRKANEDVMRYKNQSSYIHEEQSSLQTQLQESNGRVASLSHDIESMRSQMQYQKTQVETSERSLEGLSKELERSEQMAQRANMERDEYIKELENFSSQSTQQEREVQETHKRMAKLTADKNMSDSVNTSLKMEVEGLKNQMAYMRQKQGDSDKVLEQERARVQGTSENMHALETENMYLKDQVGKLNTQILSIERNLNSLAAQQGGTGAIEDALRKKDLEIAELHQEQIRLRDENGKLKVDNFKLQAERTPREGHQDTDKNLKEELAQLKKDYADISTTYLNK